MKKNLIYSVCLASALFIISCNDKKDDKPATIDKAKVGDLIEKMDNFDKYLSIGMGDLGTVEKFMGKPVVSSYGAIDGVVPDITQTSEYVLYEYDFSTAANHKGKMSIKMTSGVSSYSTDVVFSNFVDNTMKDETGRPIANLTNGTFSFAVSGLGETSSYIITINSDLTVMENNQTSKIKYTNLAMAVTDGASELNGKMELTVGSEKNTFDFAKVTMIDSCDDYPVSGTMNISSVDVTKNTTENYEINFGAGTCDNKATVKYNGATEEITLD